MATSHEQTVGCQPGWMRFCDSKTSFADKAEDIRGRQVIDSQGQTLGKVERLLLEEGRHLVRLFHVDIHSGFLGLHHHHSPIPVDCITRVTPEAIYIDRTKQQVDGVPPLTNDAKKIDRAALESIYKYYRLSPFWDPSYVAPLFNAHSHTTAHRCLSH